MIRSKRLGIILSIEEKELLRTLAKLEGGLSLAALVRLLIYKAAIANGMISISKSKENQQLTKI